jgi:hypothetical protein
VVTKVTMRCSVCFLFALDLLPTQLEARRQRLQKQAEEADKEGERRIRRWATGSQN